MIEAVLDASVVLKWFRSEGERNVAAARALRADFQLGKLVVIAPPLLFLEILNIAGRRWLWPLTALVELARALNALNIELREPELDDVARWTGTGLSAYDASYVALAEAAGITLITDDRLILSLAAHAATPLADIEEERRV